MYSGIIAVLCVALFAATALAKIVSPERFLEFMEDIMPAPWSQRALSVTVLAEIAIAVVLVTRPNIGASLVLIFIAFSSIAAACRFSKADEFACGCWGGGRRANQSTISRSSVPAIVRLTVQNVLVTQLALWLLYSENSVRHLWVVGLGVIAVPSVVAIGLIGDIHRRRMSLRSVSAAREFGF